MPCMRGGLSRGKCHGSSIICAAKCVVRRDQGGLLGLVGSPRGARHSDASNRVATLYSVDLMDP